MTRTVLGILFVLAGTSAAAETGPLLKAIKSVGREGAGNAEAGKAWASW